MSNIFLSNKIKTISRFLNTIFSLSLCQTRMFLPLQKCLRVSLFARCVIVYLSFLKLGFGHMCTESCNSCRACRRQISHHSRPFKTPPDRPRITWVGCENRFGYGQILDLCVLLFLPDVCADPFQNCRRVCKCLKNTLS